MKEQDYISEKIKKLRKEGKPQDQSVAQAISMSKQKGYKDGGVKKPEYAQTEVDGHYGYVGDRIKEAYEGSDQHEKKKEKRYKKLHKKLRG